MMEAGSRMRDVRQFHDLITCGLCRGYMVDPTTVDDCYHTYCRSCILKHLLRMPYCPDCKMSRGAKEISEITESNLRSDDVLRTLIYKMVPGLYQRECQALADFEEQHKDLVDEKSPLHQEFFTATELVSLSLEYHPAMLQQCGAGEVPPTIYLQCAAGLRVELLKRFLCSKYNIEADNKLVEVEVTYEDEVLPSHFTLMDVGYCYKWSRQSPMAFCYRILLYESERAKNDENNLSRINQDIEPGQTVSRRPKAAKSVSFAEDLESDMDTISSPRSKPRSNKSSPKVSPQSKAAKRLAKKEAEPEPVSTFKSLRSNDMRYSDYAVPRVKCEPEQELAESQREREQPLEVNTNIVVSIPPSQLIKSYGDVEDFELKTANRKVSGNLPKLKIELNSMRSKLSMPLSAHGRLEDTSSSASAQQLDLETYAKNIGLKPIEQPSVVAVADSKYSPNASPMSSCSSSTNGSTSSLGTADASTSTSTSSHRKRKKKHSKEPKDANGKRKKLHAEISSQTDGKMKVKITSTPKHKLDLKRSHSIAGGELALQQLKLDERSIQSSTSDVLNRTLGEEARSISSLVVGGAPTPPPTPTTEALVQQPPQVAVAKTKEMPSLPTSPPLPPSLFKAYTPSATPTIPAKTKVAPQHQQQQQLHQLQQQHQAHAALVKTNPAVKPPLTNNNNRKLSGGHFAVPQAPGNRNLYHMQRYQSTPSSIASAANKQPKRSLSLDESHPAKQARFQEAQAMANYTARKYPLSSQTTVYLPNPQPRLYGPDMSNKTPMPLLCPTSMSLPGSSLGSGSVTITARPRANQQGYSYPETSNQIPALEIVRLGPGGKQAGPKTMPPLSPPAASTSMASIGASGSRLMGPPAALPSKNSVKMPMPLPMPMTTIPTIVKSPPLSVALSGQRSNSSSSSSNKGNNSNNAAYRTSPPALINLRNTAPHSATFPSKSQHQQQQQQQQQQSGKTESNSKKSPPAANGTSASLEKSKTSLREFRPAVTAGAKDADILDLSANPGRNSQSNHATKLAITTSATTAATSATSITSNSSSSNSLEAALNKIKQNISANSNGGNAAVVVASSTSTNANGSSNTSNTNNNSSSNKSNSNTTTTNGSNNGDDLQNLHMLSESATAREKISIKVASFENKPKNANSNALVRPQNASVRSIPNPSALAFRNQPAAAATSATTTATSTAAATATTTTTTNISKPLTVRAEERSTKGLLSPNSTTTTTNNNNNNNNSNNNNNNNNTSSSSNNSAATSPRAMTKKPTTIDQVAANLNIRAEAKAAALAEEAPPVLSSRTSKSPELAKTTPATSSRPESKETSGGGAITVSAASTLLSMPVATATAAVSSSSVPEPLSKPPVQIAATDTLAPVASSA
ncbi:protein suppressor 2 of zeste [Drosophila ananassae]|uniref:protein suppressor 2 of zeste n=1 Tax=Drosophila ananassae TaxID=7217 RepID=UPI000177CD06|nr:protein suppressor 2 of zeste [Drosophila ananassae]